MSDRGPRDLDVREAYQRFLNRQQRKHSDATVNTKKYNLIHFVRWCEDEGIDEPAELGGWDFEAYQDHRAHLAPTTLENEIRDVRLFVRFCEDLEIVDDGLADKIDVPTATKDQQVREEKLELEDAAALLAHFRDPANGVFGSKWHAVLEVAWHTGARLGGIRGLDVRDYDRDDAILEFRHRPKSKTPLKNKLDGERDVGILPPVADALDDYVDEHRYERTDQYGRAPLFTVRSSGGRPAETTLRNWFYQATQPCWHTDDPCPHERQRDDCEWTQQTHASKCPGNTFPHAVRTGSITFHQDRGFPIEDTARRVDDDVETIKKHYDQARKRDEFERRRLGSLDKLEFNPEEYIND